MGALGIARLALTLSILIYLIALALGAASIATETVYGVALIATAAMAVTAAACIILQIVAWTGPRRRR